MDDDARGALNHLRHKQPIEPDRSQQVQIQLGLPELLLGGQETAARRTRSAKTMDKDINTPKARYDGVRDRFEAFDRCEISWNKESVANGEGWFASRACRRSGPGGPEPTHDRFARSFRPSRDEDAPASEFRGIDLEL